jgi:hypothetical protein
MSNELQSDIAMAMNLESLAIKVMWTGRGSPRVTRVLLLWP